MKNNTKLFLILLCFFAKTAVAQGLLDFTNNTQYEYNNYYKEFKSDKPYFQDNYEVTYYSFKKESNSKLNNQVLELCKSYVENEAKYLGLLRDANIRLEVLNELNNSKNYNYRSQDFKNLKLEKMECEVVSVVGTYVFYEINFVFKTDDSSGSNYDKLDFKVKHYYLGNFQNQTVARWKPTINSSNQKKLQDLVAKKFNDTYLLVTDKLKFKEISEFGYAPKEAVLDNNSSEFVNVFKIINLADADYYWYNQGIMIQFQEYSKGSTLYGGKSFRLFFTLEEALKITALIPEFWFIKKLPIISTSIKNFNPTTAIHKKLTVLNTEPLLDDLVANTTSNKLAKSMEQTMYQISDDNSKRLMNKTKYEFNTNKQLVSKIENDENNRVVGTTYYDYDAKNNLKLISRINENKQQEYTSYFYDENGNIATSNSVEDSNISNQYYFYNQNYVYTFSEGIFFDNNAYTTKYELKKDGFCNSGICYYYDKNNQIISVETARTSNYQMQIGRDSMGRIVEIHKEDDRYNYYIKYDDYNRITNFQHLEQDIMRFNVDYNYLENNILPFKKTKTSEYGGNKTVVEENYEWTYFE